MLGTPLLVGGIGTGLLAGGVFGARHALEPDHVATLVEGEDRPLLTGAAWGVGHSLPILLLGGCFLALGLQVPDGIATAFELLVGVVLVALGLRTVAGGASSLLGFSVASVLAMGIASWVWDRAVGRSRQLGGVAGVAGILVGLLLFVEIAGFRPPV